jgi:Zn-dependent peptidase ImmA (M78 family)/transcriptional regulator with XRE-family HTH domain
MSAVFNGHMLFLARQLRRVGQDELIGRLGETITQGTLSKIERGRIQPSEAIISKIADALQLRPSFFEDPSYIRQPPVSFHRARKALSSKDEAAIHARAEVYRLSIKKILNDIELVPVIKEAPAIDIDQYGGDAKEVARVTRSRWGVKRGPIRDMTSLMEDAGIIVVQFDFGTPLIDGLCHNKADGLPPLVFVNSSLPKDRLRFSLAHELGHIVMHDVPNPEQEIQANLFASEFLMPDADIIDDLHSLKLTKFMELKLHWGTSMQSIIYKAWQLGKLSDRQFKYFFIEMSKRGWKKTEPVDVQGLVETPSTLRAVISTHLGQLGYSEGELAEMLGLPVCELRSWFQVARERPKLRLVT